MKNMNSFMRELKRVFKKESDNSYQSILKNIKIQSIYTNDKINKKEHYVYFKEYDIKTNDLNYSHISKTKRLFSIERRKYKNAILFATIGSTIGIVSFVFFVSPQWNYYT
ncbi:hypothetical protein, conserved [Plasmodium gonderi]|uniref:Uncharacterized protein n=1 Tax=Plasmodium gonderi TaxID=77519 RepID=A0A1Y1JR45_PLAGO|nr:hypothetical protein, conserved [Plasmodium gonderi]GAW82504.1 hypothetical protein, conserved [Plasmodium gonderi]